MWQSDISNRETVVKIEKKEGILWLTVFSNKNRVIHSFQMLHKFQQGKNPLQLKCRQLQRPVHRCGNLIFRVYHLGLKRRTSRQRSHLLISRMHPESQPRLRQKNGWFELGRCVEMTGGGEAEEVCLRKKESFGCSMCQEAANHSASPALQRGNIWL